MTLHGLLEASARRDAAKAAFVAKDSRTSYGELAGRAGGFAAALNQLGVGRGDRVAVVLDSDVDYLVAFYGTLMAGGVAVPVCPDTRTEPLLHALGALRRARSSSSTPTTCAGWTATSPPCPSCAPCWFAATGGWPSPATSHRPASRRRPSPRRLPTPGPRARTSRRSSTPPGTTGRPKGVMLSHDNLVANVRSIVSYLALSPEDVVGMVLPFYYVYGNSVLHTHIAAGATIAHLGSLAFLAQVIQGLQDFACTGFSGVPATFARLAGFGHFARYDLSRLRYVTQAGAAMTPALIGKLRAAIPTTQVFVMYGQTEASARLSYLPPDRLDDKLGSAGKAIPGVTLKICDPQGRELPRGALGEVVAEGPNVMVGYFRDPDATARVLRPEGLRTGDLGTMDEEGFLFLKGRETEMIKSGGHRLSPLEIEQAVAKAPGVREVAVTGVPDELLGEAIAAFVIPQPGATISRKTSFGPAFSTCRGSRCRAT